MHLKPGAYWGVNMELDPLLEMPYHDSNPCPSMACINNDHVEAPRPQLKH